MSVTFYPDSKTARLELNVANGNAPIIYALLGVEVDRDEGDFGEVPAELVREKLVRLDMVDLSQLVRGETSEGNFFHCGAPLSQVEYYHFTLERMLRFCAEANCGLRWG